ncbi:MAG TPA: hypothetical protein VKY92_18120, partial [Verrucomicrobiae bacterium]|nr:hypothetical protein [Verrucomicrobiae bacterium]
MEPVIRSVVKHGNQRWEIDFGLDEFGKRRRPVFETEDEAKDDLAKWQKNVKKAGDYWANLEPTKRLAIVATLRAMDERNVSVSKVWEDWLQAQQQGINKQITPTPYDEAVIGWKDVKLEAGKDETYVYQAGRDLMKFAAGREKRHIHLFLTAELEAYFKGHTDWGLSSKKTYMSLFHSLWEVAERKGWVYNNIVDKLEPITRPGQIVRIYPNSIAKSLMAVMRAQADCTPDSSSYVCVGYLAGVAARDSGKSTCDKYRIIKVKAIELDLFGLLFEKLPSTILLERDKERQAELTKVRVEIS